jgi:hypothetical protein
MSEQEPGPGPTSRLLDRLIECVSIRQEDGTWWSYVTNLINERTSQDIAEI